MHFFVAGATGATGRLLTEQLLQRGHRVIAVVRTPGKLNHLSHYSNRLKLIEGEILAMGEEELAEILGECDGAASCLGHNISFKGLFGPPRRLVTDSIKRICESFQTAGKPEHTPFILMNTSANRDRRLEEKAYKKGDRLFLWILGRLLPPQADNEEAAQYLVNLTASGNRTITWCAVRPDTLIDETEASPIDIYPSPLRSPVTNAGKTSRINVASFMADLLENAPLRDEWAGRMPVIYNREK